MENSETTSQAALRETIEESGANVELNELFTVINVPHVNQVHLFYRANLLNLDYLAGPESLEVSMFSEDEIPWESIAFPTITHTLKTYFSVLHEKGQLNDQYAVVHCHDILKSSPLDYTTTT